MRDLFSYFFNSYDGQRKLTPKIYSYIFNFNLSRGFYLLGINTIVCSLMLTNYTINYKFTKDFNYFLCALLSVVMILFIFVFFMIFQYYKKKPHLHNKLNFIPLFLIPNFIIAAISLTISLLDNNIVIFFCYFALISTLFFITPIMIVIQSLTIGFFFFIMTPILKPSFPNYTLTTYLIILISAFISYTIYNNKYIEFQLFSNFKEKNLVLKESNKELSEFSYSDALTGVNNRRRIEDLLKINWKYCKTNKLNLSVIFIDIDNFKRYNDMYGHVQGDKCLVKIATSIEAICNTWSDSHYCTMGRYGGEEFIIILPNTDKQKVVNLANNVCKAVEDLRIEHNENDEYSHVTISCGTTTCIPDDDKRILHILETADRALYQVKRSGKNNVIHFDDIPFEL